MQGNAERSGAQQHVDRVGRVLGAGSADVSSEIAAAQASAHRQQREYLAIKANNLGFIGVTVKCKSSGDEIDLPVSLELYQDLDRQGLHTYLADAARRLGACEPISETHRLFPLPDSY